MVVFVFGSTGALVFLACVAVISTGVSDAFTAAPALWDFSVLSVRASVSHLAANGFLRPQLQRSCGEMLTALRWTCGRWASSSTSCESVYPGMNVYTNTHSKLVHHGVISANLTTKVWCSSVGFLRAIKGGDTTWSAAWSQSQDFKWVLMEPLDEPIMTDHRGLFSWNDRALSLAAVSHRVSGA